MSEATEARYSARWMSAGVARARPSPIQLPLTLAPSMRVGPASARPSAPATAPSVQPAAGEGRFRASRSIVANARGTDASGTKAAASASIAPAIGPGSQVSATWRRAAALIVQKRAFSAARGLAGGRGPLARLLAYDIATQDEHAIARAAIEAVARTFCVGVVAARIGHVPPTHDAFGGTATNKASMAAPDGIDPAIP